MFINTIQNNRLIPIIFQIIGNIKIVSIILFGVFFQWTAIIARRQSHIVGVRVVSGVVGHGGVFNQVQDVAQGVQSFFGLPLAYS